MACFRNLEKSQLKAGIRLHGLWLLCALHVSWIHHEHSISLAASTVGGLKPVGKTCPSTVDKDHVCIWYMNTAKKNRFKTGDSLGSSHRFAPALFLSHPRLADCNFAKDDVAAIRWLFSSGSFRDQGHKPPCKNFLSLLILFRYFLWGARGRSDDWNN